MIILKYIFILICLFPLSCNSKTDQKPTNFIIIFTDDLDMEI